MSEVAGENLQSKQKHRGKPLGTCERFLTADSPVLDGHCPVWFGRRVVQLPCCACLMVTIMLAYISHNIATWFLHKSWLQPGQPEVRVEWKFLFVFRNRSRNLKIEIPSGNKK